MAVDLSAQLRRGVEASLKKALAATDDGDAAKAADHYDHASRLALLWAEQTPSRRLEQHRKSEALRYREIASKLRQADEAPAALVPGALPLAGAPALGESGAEIPEQPEIRDAVRALVHTADVTWDEIGGLDATKADIKYSLGVALAQPPAGVRVALWRNLLFYGPPGTGKTLLAAATSNALRTKSSRAALFFNVKVSSVMSKYFGESSKIVSEIYGTARDHSPAVVFLDEFEALSPKRSDENSGAERRLLSTILAELDGLKDKGASEVFVLTIAATNRPWDVDAAVLSRFEKKVLIPLPDAATRRRIFEILLAGRGYELSMPLTELVERTVGWSGREIERLTKDAIGRMIAEQNAELPALVDQGFDAVRGYALKVRPLAEPDFVAIGHWSPATSPKEMAKYREWKEATDL